MLFQKDPSFAFCEGGMFETTCEREDLHVSQGIRQTSLIAPTYETMVEQETTAWTPL